MRGGGRQGKKGGEGIYERGFRREEETGRSTKGDRREGTGGGWIHCQELQIWLWCKLHAYQLTTETSQSSICPAENCGTLWHKATI